VCDHLYGVPMPTLPIFEAWSLLAAVASVTCHVELGTLKGNQGDQNYDLPAAVDLNQYQAVAIYCERFHAIFGVARLEQF